MFSKGRIFGFDIDLQHFLKNKPDLVRRGAFSLNQPVIQEYDQFLDGTDQLASTLAGKTLDVVIDDGFHSLETIITTWRSVKPQLSSKFVYFIEDYVGLLDVCGSEFLGYDARSFGLMTVISAGVPVLEQ